MDYWGAFNIAIALHRRSLEDYWGEFNIASIAQEVTGGLLGRI